MDASARRALAACLLSATAALFTGRPAEAQGSDPRLEKVFTDWQKRYDRIKTVRYRVTGERVIAKGSNTDDAGRPLVPESPPKDIVEEDRLLFLLDFTTNRHRLERSEKIWLHQTGTFVPRVAISVFDGAACKGAMPRDENTSPDFTSPASQPDVTICTGNLKTLGFEPVYWPIFSAHGIITAYGDSAFPGKLSPSQDKESFLVQGEGVRSGRPCLVLRTEPREGGRTSYDELWVDVARDSAVVRQLQVVNDVPITDQEVDFQEVSGSWLPSQWTFTARVGRRTIYTERLRVDEVEVGPAVSKADFQIDVRPGMLVEQTQLGGTPDHPMSSQAATTKYFHVDANGSWNEVVDGVEQKRSWAWLWWPVALAVAGLGAWAMWRFRRRKAAAAR
jgi:hypothetical protein